MNEKQPEKKDRCYQIPNPVLLRLTGSDRQKWLHNFCTADIKKLEPGQGCEAFVLNVKGKTMAHVIVLATKYDLTLMTLGATELPLTEHFLKYIITEDVQIEDLTGNQDLWYVTGDRMDRMFESRFPSREAYQHSLVRDQVIAVSTQISQRPDWLLLVNKTDPVAEWNAGMDRMTEVEFDFQRFTNRFPLTGIDVSVEHLPQEYGRDKEAISFTKGCYLGQETVARIDALGHVNYLFVQLALPSETIAKGAELTRDAKVVGSVSTISGNRGLGFVRRLMAKPDERFQCAEGEVRVL